MAASSLGRSYSDGETIIRQGDAGDCMYVIQAGNVIITHQDSDQEVVLAELAKGDFFGEMALFARELRSATVRAKGDASVLTVDRRTLLSRIQKDPSLAFRILERMSNRIRVLDGKYSRLKASSGED